MTSSFIYTFFVFLLLPVLPTPKRSCNVICMAACWKTALTFGKRSPSLFSPIYHRRVAIASVYDQNPVFHIRPAIVPDGVILQEFDKYWAPHPETGVFGPASGHKTTTLEAKPANAGGSSVLEHTAWFRPTSLEDMEKPLQS